jgi:hypothetical protein
MVHSSRKNSFGFRGKISVFARQREIARTRESATAAEGGTHVYLNSTV